MKSESLKQILAFLTRILEKNDFNEDKQIIQYLFKELEKLEHQLPTDNKLEELQRIVIDLEIKYDDFNDLIQRASHDDYVFLVYGMKMAEYGFFDLSDALIAKLDDNGFTSSYVSDIKKNYYPSAMVNPKDVV